MENKEAYTGTQPSSATPALPPYVPSDAATGQYGQPNEHQPLAGHPIQPGYGATQQQQPQVIVVYADQQQQPRPTAQQNDYVWHIVFSCVVLWLCNWIFGLVAFSLAS